MREIWKFPLRVQREQSVRMPVGAEILTAQVQRLNPGGLLDEEQICLWALVDTSKRQENVDRTIGIFGTGHEIPDGSFAHIGTVQLRAGALVLHVFDIGVEVT